MTELSSRTYRPASALTTSVSILLGTTIFVRCLSILTGLFLILSGKIKERDPEELTTADWLNCGICCLALPLFIATVIVWCFWIYRANSNAHALGAAGMEYTPGWSVGWWFVPIMLLFKPFNAVSETWRASAPEDASGSSAWKSVSAPWYMGVWWGCWIIGNILSNVSLRLTFMAKEDATMLMAATVVEILADLLLIPAALLAIIIVRTIYSRQQEKAASQGFAA